MTLSTIVILVLALYLLQLFAQEISRFGFNLKALVGNRDHPPAMSTVAARLDRARHNMIEAMPFFLGLTMLAFASGHAPEAVRGATVFLVARVLYVPAYASGLPWLRSLLWLTGNAGLLLMAFDALS